MAGHFWLPAEQPTMAADNLLVPAEIAEYIEKHKKEVAAKLAAKKANTRTGHVRTAASNRSSRRGK